MSKIKEFYHDEICKMQKETSESFNDIFTDEQIMEIGEDLLNAELPSWMHSKL